MQHGCVNKTTSPPARMHAHTPDDTHQRWQLGPTAEPISHAVPTTFTGAGENTAEGMDLNHKRGLIQSNDSCLSHQTENVLAMSSSKPGGQ